MAKKRKVAKLNVLLSERKRIAFFGLPFSFTTYTITDKKLIIKQGFFTLQEDEVLLFRIKDLTVKRPFNLRIFGLGCLDVVSSDASLKNFQIKNIKNVQLFREILSEQIDKERVRLKYRPGEIIEGDGADDSGMHEEDDNFFDGEFVN